MYIYLYYCRVMINTRTYTKTAFDLIRNRFPGEHYNNLQKYLQKSLILRVFYKKIERPNFFLLVPPNHTAEVQRTLRGRHAPVSWYKPPEGSPEGVPFSEASSRAAKRGSAAGSAERSEAVPPPSEARLHRGSAERSEAARRSSGGRHYKKTQKGSTRKPRGATYFFYPFYRGLQGRKKPAKIQNFQIFKYYCRFKFTAKRYMIRLL